MLAPWGQLGLGYAMAGTPQAVNDMINQNRRTNLAAQGQAKQFQMQQAQMEHQRKAYEDAMRQQEEQTNWDRTTKRLDYLKWANNERKALIEQNDEHGLKSFDATIFPQLKSLGVQLPDTTQDSNRLAGAQSQRNQAFEREMYLRNASDYTLHGQQPTIERPAIPPSYLPVQGFDAPLQVMPGFPADAVPDPRATKLRGTDVWMMPRQLSERPEWTVTPTGWRHNKVTNEMLPPPPGFEAKGGAGGFNTHQTQVDKDNNLLLIGEDATTRFAYYPGTTEKVKVTDTKGKQFLANLLQQRIASQKSLYRMFPEDAANDPLIKKWTEELDRLVGGDSPSGGTKSQRLSPVDGYDIELVE